MYHFLFKRGRKGGKIKPRVHSFKLLNIINREMIQLNVKVLVRDNAIFEAAVMFQSGQPESDYLIGMDVLHGFFTGVGCFFRVCFYFTGRWGYCPRFPI